MTDKGPEDDYFAGFVPGTKKRNHRKEKAKKTYPKAHCRDSAVHINIPYLHKINPGD